MATNPTRCPCGLAAASYRSRVDEWAVEDRWGGGVRRVRVEAWDHAGNAGGLAGCEVVHYRAAEEDER